MNNPDELKLYQKAIRYLSLRAHSTAEIRQKLSRLPAGKLQAKKNTGSWRTPSPGVDQGLIDSVLTKLISQGLLNDPQFAQDFIRYQLSARPQGERALAYKLKTKGIEPGIIRDAIKSAFADADLSYQLAQDALRRKNWSHLPLAKQVQKTASFLSGRGFSYSVIRRFVDDLYQKE